jgi:hypothetical protein
MHFYEREAAAFQVIEPPQVGLTARVDFSGDYPGIVRPLLEWETKQL